MIRGRLTSGHWERPERFYDFVAPVVVGLAAVVARVHVTGAGNVPPTGPVLLAANHPSKLDPLVLAAVLHRCGRKVRFLALSTLWDVQVLGWLLHHARMIPVVRGGGVERMTDDACAALAAGQAVLVYPEGTIVRGGARAPAKPGAGLVALRSRAPVVPVSTVGLEPRGGLARWLPWPRRRVGVAIGPPLNLSPWGGRTDRRAQLAAAEHMLDAVRRLQPRAAAAARATGQRRSASASRTRSTSSGPW